MVYVWRRREWCSIQSRMASVEEKVKTCGVGVVGGQTLVAEMKLLKEMQEHSGLFLTISPFSKSRMLNIWFHICSCL